MVFADAASALSLWRRGTAGDAGARTWPNGSPPPFIGLAASLSLVGLNSADFLVDGESFWLLEINPRPGATLDIFEPPEGSLFAMHMAACAGKLAAAPHCPDGAKASAIVYAENDIASVPALDWPDWTADRPVAGSTIKAGEPLCTVYAYGSAAAAARAIADQRREMVLAWTSGRKS